MKNIKKELYAFIFSKSRESKQGIAFILYLILCVIGIIFLMFLLDIVAYKGTWTFWGLTTFLSYVAYFFQYLVFMFQQVWYQMVLLYQGGIEFYNGIVKAMGGEIVQYQKVSKPSPPIFHEVDAPAPPTPDPTEGPFMAFLSMLAFIPAMLKRPKRN
jgi:Na+/melibiose symporter-like transporter